jgi:hypothetical protein
MKCGTDGCEHKAKEARKIAFPEHAGLCGFCSFKAWQKRLGILGKAWRERPITERTDTWP